MKGMSDASVLMNTLTYFLCIILLQRFIPTDQSIIK